MRLVQKLSDNTKEFLDEFYAIIDEMELRMRSVEPAESISVTYAQQIEPYFEAAISLIQNVLNYTTNINIEDISKELVSQVEDWINLLGEINDDCLNIENTETERRLYQREFESILTRLISQLRTSRSDNNLNANFLSEIVVFLQAGINFGKNVLRFEICERLRDFVEEMLRIQTKLLIKVKQLQIVVG